MLIRNIIPKVRSGCQLECGSKPRSDYSLPGSGAKKEKSALQISPKCMFIRYNYFSSSFIKASTLASTSASISNSGV